MKRILTLIYCFLSCAATFANEGIISFHLTSANGLPDNNIYYMEQDKTGYLRMASLYAAYLYDGYNFRRLPDSEFRRLQKKYPNKYYGSNAPFYDNNGNKVTVGKDGFITWHDKKSRNTVRFQVFDESTLNISNNLKLRVVSTKDGHLWVSVNGNGVFCYDRKTGKLQHLTVNNSNGIISNDFIVFMMEDRDGNIWISEENNGLLCLRLADDREYEILDVNGPKDNRNNVRMLRRLSDGSIIIADNYGGVYRSFDELRTWKAIPRINDTFISACLDSHGWLWLGSRKKGVRVGNKWYSNERVDCIIRDSKGRMWMCGLRKPLTLASLSIDGKYKERQFIKEGDLKPRVLMQDHTGRIWMGTVKGLYVFNPDRIIANPKAYKKVSNLPVRSLFEDIRQQLWIGTEGKGAFVGRLGEDIRDFRNFSTANGLSNDVVQFITEDSHHNICIGTEDGCAYLSPKGAYLYTLSFPEDLERNFFNERSAVMLHNGNMAFATVSNIVIADKNICKVVTGKRNVAITGLTINGINAYDMGEDSPITGNISNVRDITLKHNQNSLTISVSAFYYEGYNHTLYSFRLEGYDKDWSPASSLNSTSYKNLPAGTYKFRMRYKLAGGTWQESPHTLQIVIKPPLWLTWWAFIIYAIIIAAIAWIIYRQLRNTYRLRQRIAIEKQVTEFKLVFFTNISHEFRTPLTLIQTAIDKIKSIQSIPAEMKQPISNMQHNVDRMRRLINQLLEFRKMQKGKLSLSLQKTDIISFLYNIWGDFHEAAENKHITFLFLPQEKHFEMYIDRGHIDKIVYNLLSNAFKYTPNGGRIELSIKIEGDSVRIIVSDTGIGISKDKQAQIFDRYSTGNVSPDSIGIGLNLTRELVHVHHGNISYEQNPGGGSIFTVTLPAGKDGYKEQDFLKTNTGLEVVKDDEKQDLDTAIHEIQTEPMNNKTVFVVEDDTDICSMLLQELSRYFTIETASDGQEAWEKLHEESFKCDIIISDIMMPRMDGYKLLQHIRKDPALRTLPVILLTALANNDKQVKGLEIGADAYISKPFDMKLLITQIANLIKQREALQNDFAKGPKPKAEVKEVIRSEKEKKFVEQFDTIVKNHLDDSDLDIASIAAMFNMGKTTFYNTVKRLTGKSPNAYINDVRLHTAADLLREGNYTVAEVTYRVGYNNPQYLATQFKKKFGMTPKEYQNGK